MKCPKCHETMKEIHYGGVAVDRCENCGGIWFDFSEAEQLRHIAGSESIDRGDLVLGRLHNQIGDITCPRCHAKMIKMVDRRQPHIWYEGCSNCYGIYFDAGEFTDFKEITFLDKIKDLFSPERR